MNTEKFIELFKEQFDFFEEEFVIEEKTEFKNLDDWDSLVALSVIAMADEHYDVKISGDDIRNSTTVGEIMNLVATRKV